MTGTAAVAANYEETKYLWALSLALILCLAVYGYYNLSHPQAHIMKTVNSDAAEDHTFEQILVCIPGSSLVPMSKSLNAQLIEIGTWNNSILEGLYAYPSGTPPPGASRFTGR